ncbi:MAG: FG-GAP-like repeat-containing protein [Leptospirales bacterium]
MKIINKLYLVTAFFALFVPGAIFGVVNSNGSYSQKVEIELPEGRHKAKPSLSLMYNSGGGNGIVGMGWAVQGAPSIRRHPGVNGLSFNENATYSGIGGELVDISGDQSVYHTKNEIYYRYTPIYGSCGLGPKEPCGWKVVSPGGQVLYFGVDEDGDSGNSRIMADNGKGFVFWGFRAAVDLNNNSITYEYENTDGYPYLNRILYTKGAGISRLHAVTFHYEERPDVQEKYVGGAFQRISKRLQSIKVSGNVYCAFDFCTDGDLIRAYEMEYKTGTTTGRSLLSGLKEIGNDGVSSKPPLTFSWIEGKNDNSQFDAITLSGVYSESTAFDINGDSLTDLLRYHDTGSEINIAYVLSTPSGWTSQSANFVYNITGWELQAADINGDGKKDLVFSKGTAVKYALGNGSSWGSLTTARAGDEVAIGWSLSTADIDKDGLTDLLYYYNYYPDHETACSTCEHKTMLQSQKNRGQGFAAPVTVFESLEMNTQWYFSSANLNDDLDSDFIIYNVKDGVQVRYILSQDGGYSQLITAYQLSEPDTYWQVTTGDYNGDGKSDLMYLKQDYNSNTGDNILYVSLQTANGAGFNAFEQIHTSSRTGMYQMLPVDVNGDRRADLILKDNKDDKCNMDFTIMENRSQGLSAEQTYNISETGGADCSMSMKFGDFNGDQLLDINYTVSDGTIENKFLHMANSDPVVNDKIVEIQNNFGSSFKVSYETLASHSGAIDPLTENCGGATGTGYNAPCGISLGYAGFVVQRISMADGRGNEFFKSYAYANRRYRPGRGSNAKSLGFQYFTIKDEFIGSFKVQSFRQDPGFEGVYLSETEYNGENQIMSRFSYVYSSDLSTIFPGTNRIKTDQQIYEKYESGQFSLKNSKFYTYNGYGQIVSVIDQADSVETVEFQYTYEIDTDLWILDRQINVKKLVQGVIVDWDKFTYVNHNKVKEERYLNSTNSFVSDTFAYDSYGNVIQKTDANGNTYSVEYETDYHTKAISEVNSIGHVQTYEYDPLYVTVVAMSDSNGNSSSSEIDPFYRLTKLNYPGGKHSKEILYQEGEGDPSGQYIEIRYSDESPSGYSYIRHYYDGLNRIYKKIAKGAIVDENGNVSQDNIISEYEFYGTSDENHIKISKPYLEGLQTPVFKIFSYDSYGRISKIQNYDGSFMQLAYKSNVVEQYDVNNKLERVVADARGREIIRQNYDGNVLLSSLETTYNPLEQITQDADGSVTVATYDTLERTEKIVEGSKVWQFKHDANGNLIQQVNPKGDSVYFQYDAMNRMARKSYNSSDDELDVVVGDELSGDEDGAVLKNNTVFGKPKFPRNKAVTYVYDDPTQVNSIGHLSHVYDASGKTSYSYDERGNISNMVKEIGDRKFGFSAKYNSEKKVTQITYPDGSTIGNIYSNSSYLRQVRWYDASEPDTDGHPVVTYTGPDKDFQLVRITGNGARDMVTYDRLSMQPTGVKTNLFDNEGESIQVRDLEYSMDGQGNMLSIVDNIDNGSSEHFEYDGLNRLTYAQGAYGARSYSYSPGGNLLQKGEKELFYEDKSQPQTVTSDTIGNKYAYDKNGSMVKHNDRIFHYNVNNQLVSINQKKNGKIAEFQYNDKGTRTVKKTKDGRITYYFHFLSETEPLFEVQITDEKGGKQSERVGGSQSFTHTNYVYGMYNEIVAQITRKSGNIYAFNKVSEAVAAQMANPANASGFIQKAYLLSNLWVSDISNIKQSVLVFFLLAIALFLMVFIYNLGKANTASLGFARKVYHYSTPLIFTAFFWFFGAGCGNISNVDASDTDFWSSIPENIPDDISDVGEPGGNLEVSARGGYPVEGAFFFHPDHVGSVRYLSDSQGRLLTRINYTPYGEIDRDQSSGPDILRYKYTHQEEDRETGLYNYNARMYDSESGRFTTADTELPGEGQISQGFNRYMYTLGNPVKYVDPTGHSPVGGGAIPLHNYTGPGRNQDSLTAQCTTGIDCMSQGHDAAGASLMPMITKELTSNRATSIGVLMNNITADVLWIIGGAYSFITGANFVHNAKFLWNSEFADKWANGDRDALGWIMLGIATLVFYPILLALLMVYEVVVFVIGVALFTLNIILSSVLVAMQMFAGFMQGIFDLFNGKSLKDLIDNFAREVESVLNDIGRAVKKFFKGW